MKEDVNMVDDEVGSEEDEKVSISEGSERSEKESI